MNSNLMPDPFRLVSVFSFRIPLLYALFDASLEHRPHPVLIIEAN
jgi:hypothetical protein